MYNSPRNRFVAGFIGSPPMNFLDGSIKDRRLEYEEGCYTLPDRIVLALREDKASEVTLGIRPENIQLFLREMPHSIRGRTSIVQTLGSDNFVAVEVGGENIFLIRISPKENIPLDSEAWLKLDTDRVHLFDQKSGERMI
jgi:multiple sugar transport system ATP-binding protein